MGNEEVDYHQLKDDVQSAMELASYYARIIADRLINNEEQVQEDLDNFKEWYAKFNAAEEALDTVEDDMYASQLASGEIKPMVLS
jgi:hypothetical protein